VTDRTDEVMREAVRLGLPVYAPIDTAVYPWEGVVIAVGLADRRLEALRGRYALAPSGRRHVIVEPLAADR
jgi:hypothetical protein